MMSEWGIPTVYLQSMAYDFAKILDNRGEYVPDMAIAGGFTLEDQIFKGLPLGAPYFKLIGMARSPITACMVGKTLANKIDSGTLPKSIEKYGNDLESVFVEMTDLRKNFNGRADYIPGSAVGLYSYYRRLEQGLQQFMCGARKFALNYIDRGDILSITEEAASVSGIPYLMEYDNEEIEKILK